MKECDEKQIYSIYTNRCINIDSPTFNKRLKEQLEKNVKHFSSSDLKKLGYKVRKNVKGGGSPQNTSIAMNTNPQNASRPQNVSGPQNVELVETACQPTKDILSITKKMLLKFRDESKDNIYEYRFVNDNQKKYCNNGKSVLLDNPLITDTITYNFTYLKSDLQGTFDKKMLLYNNNKPWEVALINNTGAPKIELNLLNYDRMNPFTDDVRNKFIDQLDIEWFNKMNEYVSNLNIDDLFAIKAYTYNGDVFINNRLRNLEPEKMSKCLKTISGDKYVNNPQIYFPLFFPILEIIFNNKPEQLTDDVKQLKILIQDIELFQKEKTNNTYMDYFNQTDRLKLYISIVLVARILKEEIIIKAIDKLILKLNEIIKNSPPTEKKMIVYRGDKTDTYFKNDTKNKFFKNKGFISTTLSYVNASIFTDEKGLDKSLKTSENCCMKEITILPGSKLLFVGGVSTVPREIEFVLGTNTTYLMRKYRDKVYGKDYMHCNHGITRPTTLMTRLVALEDCRKQ